jgi:hypothetical protein
MAMNGVTANISNVGSGNVMYGSRVLITVVSCMVMIGCMIIGCSERVQVFGHHVEARCDVVQFTSGLCALASLFLR